MPVCNFVHNRVKTGSLGKALAHTAARRAPRVHPPPAIKTYKFFVNLHTIMTPTFFLRSWARASLMYLSITNKMQRYTAIEFYVPTDALLYK